MLFFLISINPTNPPYNPFPDPTKTTTIISTTATPASHNSNNKTMATHNNVPTRTTVQHRPTPTTNDVQLQQKTTVEITTQQQQIIPYNFGSNLIPSLKLIFPFYPYIPPSLYIPTYVKKQRNSLKKNQGFERSIPLIPHNQRIREEIHLKN